MSARAEGRSEKARRPKHTSLSPSQTSMWRFTFHHAVAQGGIPTKNRPVSSFSAVLLLLPLPPLLSISGKGKISKRSRHGKSGSVAVVVAPPSSLITSRLHRDAATEKERFSHGMVLATSCPPRVADTVGGCEMHANIQFEHTLEALHAHILKASPSQTYIYTGNQSFVSMKFVMCLICRLMLECFEAGMFVWGKGDIAFSSHTGWMCSLLDRIQAVFDSFCRLCEPCTMWTWVVGM